MYDLTLYERTEAVDRSGGPAEEFQRPLRVKRKGTLQEELNCGGREFGMPGAEPAQQLEVFNGRRR